MPLCACKPSGSRYRLLVRFVRSKALNAPFRLNARAHERPQAVRRAHSWSAGVHRCFNCSIGSCFRLEHRGHAGEPHHAFAGLQPPPADLAPRNACHAALRSSSFAAAQSGVHQHGCITRALATRVASIRWWAWLRVSPAPPPCWAPRWGCSASGSRPPPRGRPRGGRCAGTGARDRIPRPGPRGRESGGRTSPWTPSPAWSSGGCERGCTPCRAMLRYKTHRRRAASPLTDDHGRSAPWQMRPGQYWLDV